MPKPRIAKATRFCVALALGGFAAHAAAMSAVELFAKISPSVWKVVVFDDANKPFAIGSAVVVAPEVMVTNCHVVEKARRVQVWREKSVLDAEVDLRSIDRDLCQINVRGLKSPPVAMRETSRVQVGQLVYAIGNPENLDLTLSSGLVSAIRRDKDGHVRYIQTSAAISHGSSGGGLFDEDGRLLGLTTSVYRDGQNLNFAIPADWIKELWASNGRRYPVTPDPVPVVVAAQTPPPTLPLPQPIAVPAPSPSLPAPTPAPAPAPKPEPPARPVIVAAAPAPAPGSAPSTPRAREFQNNLRSGDEIEYTVRDEFTGQTQLAIFRVDDIDERRVRFNAGGRTEALDGRVLEMTFPIAGDMDLYSPPHGWVEPGQIAQGKWSSKFTRMDGPANCMFDLDAAADGDAVVKTAAGDFTTQVVRYSGWMTKSGVTGTAMTWRIKVRVWYAPALGRVVRFQSDIQPSTHGVYQNTASRQTVELNRIRLK